VTRRCRLGAVLLAPALVTISPAAGPAPVRVVSPPANAALRPGRFWVICKGPAGTLSVGGRPRPWGPFAEPVRAACLDLGPGRHEVRVGDQSVAVWVGGEGAPPGWAAGRPHPISEGAAGCAGCHETAARDGLTTVGAVRPFSSCLECHPPSAFEAKHAHPLAPLKDCGACHAPHGTAYKGLLKAPAKKLCASCHDS
jgi:predicted CXXCH cytochrome family protein